MSDEAPAHHDDVPLADDHDDEAEAVDEEDPAVPEKVRERRLRETDDDESAERHRVARETANPDDHRDEPPHNS